jgi:crotonobetainyl-CoA:carnitine CoA-transferase CaiB-like acyl-CoA transferase
MGGALNTNGYEDRPPVKEALDANLFLANSAAALGTMMAHHYCQESGEGQRVDISVQEVTASRNMTGKIFYQFDKKFLRRSGDRHHMGLQTARWIWPCKDGYVWFNLMGGKVGAPAGQALTKWIEDDGLENPLKSVKDWKKYDRSTVDPKTRQIFETAIARFFMNHTKKEIAEEGLRRGIRACVANTPADLQQHPQLVGRDFWVELNDDEEDHSLKYPKLFFQASESENHTYRRAPKLGEHNRDIYMKELGLSEEELVQLKRENVI